MKYPLTDIQFAALEALIHVTARNPHDPSNNYARQTARAALCGPLPEPRPYRLGIHVDTPTPTFVMPQPDTTSVKFTNSGTFRAAAPREKDKLEHEIELETNHPFLDRLHVKVYASGAVEYRCINDVGETGGRIAATQDEAIVIADLVKEVLRTHKPDAPQPDAPQPVSSGKLLHAFNLHVSNTPVEVRLYERGHVRYQFDSEHPLGVDDVQTIEASSDAAAIIHAFGEHVLELRDTLARMTEENRRLGTRLAETQAAFAALQATVADVGSALHSESRDG